MRPNSSSSFRGIMRTLRNSSRIAAAAALLGLCLAGPVAAQTVATDSPAIVHIDNFGRVNANYYRGAQPEGRDYADLKALGVKTVIDLTSDDSDANEPAAVKAVG